MTRQWIPLSLAGLILAAGTAAVSARSTDTKPPTRPERIASINLCADQLVLELADRAQIAGLSRNAQDPQMSAEAVRARGLHILKDSAEQLLVVEPDLIVGMPAHRSTALQVLGAGNYNTLDIQTANSFEEIKESIRQTAHGVGNVGAGEALIAQMERDLAAVPRNGAGKVAAYYQRRGFMTGTGTLIDDIMQRLGLVNLAHVLNKPPLAQVSLEEMVAAQPDYLIVESSTDQIEDQGAEMLHHPALADMPRISIPQAWTVCGTPAYVTAARSIAAQIAKSRGAGAQGTPHR
jgi:iron complex transport system substrate-binding protein